MTIGNTLAMTIIAAALGALVVPAFAQQGSNGRPSRPDHGMSMGHMGQGMMSGGMMAGCAEMMQSMNNGGNGTPNSQWQRQPRRNTENGG
jgi:hypothetical protein